MSDLERIESSRPPRKKRIKKSGVIRPVGPYSKDVVLGRLDRRTREGMYVETYKEELIKHLGGAPSVVHRRMIDLAAQLALRIGLMDDRFAATSVVTELESNLYLAWANTLSKLLASLGAEPVVAAQRQLSLPEYIQQRANMTMDGVVLDEDPS